MKKWVWWFVAIMWIQETCCGFASPENETPAKDIVVGKTQEGVPILQRSRVIYADSSEAYRQSQHHQLSVGFGLLVASVTYGYLLRPNWILEGYVQKQLEFVEGDAMAYMIGMKRIQGDSFYLRPSVALRQSRSPQFDNTINQQTSQLHQDWGLDLSVGNQWSWSRFVLNAEWAGFYIPLLRKDKGDGMLLQFRLVQLSVGMAW